MFAETASKVEGELLPIIQADVTNVLAITVTGFVNGTVTANFFVVMDENAAKSNNTISLIRSSITNAITNGNFSTLELDSSFNYTMKGE